MTTFTSLLQLGREIIDVPLYYEGKKSTTPESATVQYENRKDRGALLYRIGIEGSKIVPQGFREVNEDVRRMLELELDARGASEIARVFQHTGVKAGPTVYATQPGSGSPEWTRPILRSLTPLLIPDWMHMEAVYDALCATNLPADLISDAISRVVDVRMQARFIAA